MTGEATRFWTRPKGPRPLLTTARTQELSPLRDTVRYPRCGTHTGSVWPKCTFESPKQAGDVSMVLSRASPDFRHPALHAHLFEVHIVMISW